MKLEVLMSTMDQTDFSIAKNSNIQTDAIIINQTTNFSYSQINKKEKTIKMYSVDERGIGKSRNKALMNATGDICLLADDDVHYNDNYENIILEEFVKRPDADIIIFDLYILEKEGYRSYRNKNKRINKLNFMKHGGPKIAFKRKSILKKNIFFSLLFGGGAKYGSGEDTLFLKECLDAGLKIYETEKNIGEIDNRDSSWFEGYNNKYFYDKGALYKAMYPKAWPIMCLQHIVRHHRQDHNPVNKLNVMKKGAREY